MPHARARVCVYVCCVCGSICGMLCCCRVFCVVAVYFCRVWAAMHLYGAPEKVVQFIIHSCAPITTLVKCPFSVHQQYISICRQKDAHQSAATHSRQAACETPPVANQSLTSKSFTGSSTTSSSHHTGPLLPSPCDYACLRESDLAV